MSAFERADLESATTGRRQRPEGIRVEWLTLAVSGLLVALYNSPFWSEVLRVMPAEDLRGLGFVAGLAVVLLLVTNLLLLLFSFPRVLKPALVAILVTSAVAAYFIREIGVRIDQEMIVNVLQTDRREVQELLNLRLFAYVFALGVLPSIVVWRLRIRSRSWLRGLAARAIVVAVSLGAVALFAFGFYADLLALGHASPGIRNLLTPVNYVYATVKVVRQRIPHTQDPIEPVGLDAVHSTRASGRPRLVVFVLGETARSGQFSLNGYERTTNPELAEKPVVSFTDVEACGTATAESVPCIFSRWGHDEIDPGRVRHQEGLLDVLAHAGLRTLWRENSSGCKGACDRVETELVSDIAPPELCPDGECYDEALLAGLAERLPADRDSFVVLHQQGSHGPTYDRRYPDRFRRFLPVCASGDLRSCSRQEVVNAYDNTMLYTDYFLASVIDWLQGEEERYDTAMVYVSDHGESLGENGVYLHGLPELVAPPEQTRVPWIVWLSPDFARATRIRRSCLEKARDEPLSHDNVFHSMLGLTEVDTEVYDPALDLFAPCREGRSGAETSIAEAEPATVVAGIEEELVTR